MQKNQDTCCIIAFILTSVESGSWAFSNTLNACGLMAQKGCFLCIRKYPQNQYVSWVVRSFPLFHKGVVFIIHLLSHDCTFVRFSLSYFYLPKFIFSSVRGTSVSTLIFSARSINLFHGSLITRVKDKVWYILPYWFFSLTLIQMKLKTIPRWEEKNKKRKIIF